MVQAKVENWFDYRGIVYMSFICVSASNSAIVASGLAPRVLVSRFMLSRLALATITCAICTG